MADLNAIRLQDEQVHEAERLAIAGLAGYLREAVEMLPDEATKLCRLLLNCSDDLEDMVEWRGGMSSGAGLRMWRLERELRRGDYGEEA